MKDNSQSIVLFLGAGFSVHAKYPCMAQFGDRSEDFYSIKDLLRHLTPPPNPKHRYEAGLLANAGRIYKEFEKWCNRAINSVKVDCRNMETIFCAAEALAESGVPAIQLGNDEISIKYLREQIQLALYGLYRPLYPIENAASAKNYSAFIESVKKSRAHTCVVTTNYDIAVEYFCWMNGWCGIYPFDHNNSRSLTIGTGTDKYVHSVRPSSPSGDDSQGPLICKLHGSINFFSSANDDNECIGVADNVATAHTKIGNSDVKKDRPAISMLDSAWAIRAKYGSAMTPAIIPPTYAKLHGTAWLRQIWAAAREALTSADKIIFIGYSMPPSDGFMIAMFHTAMAARNGRPLAVIAFDPCRAVCDRYEYLFKPLTNVKTYPLKFEDIVGNKVLLDALNCAP